MSVPSYCPIGKTFLNFPSQPAFSNGAFTENPSGWWTFPGGTEALGVGDNGIEHDLTLGNLPINGLVVIANFDFLSNDGTQILDNSPYPFAGIALASNTTTPLPTDAKGTFIGKTVDGNLTAAISGSGGASYLSTPLSFDTVYPGTTTLTVGPLKLNLKYDLTVRLQIPGASIDQTFVYTDQFNSTTQTLCKLFLTVPAANVSLSYLKIKSLQITGFGFPNNCPAPPPAPTLIAPSNGATNIPLSQNFSWNAAAGADTYRIQIASDAGFSALVYDVSGIASTNITESLPASTTLWWRVNATNGIGTSAYSSVFSFTTVPASLPPTLLSPANSATGVSLTPTLTVTDNNSPPSDSFDFQIATDSGFTTIVYQATAVSNNNVASTLASGVLYYWRSRAKVGTVYSSYSSTFTFTTAVLTLITPDEGQENVPLQPMLVTSGLVGASAYNIQLSQFSDMHAPDYDVTVAAPMVSYHIPSNLRPFTIYYWRARAIVDGVPQSFTGIRFFITAPVPAVVSAPQNPEVMMRFSTDRGKTWSDEDWQEVGGNGSYEGRNRWVGLGSGYGIAFWFRTVSDRYVSWRGGRFRAQ